MLLSNPPDMPEAMRIIISLSFTSILFMGATALLYRWAMKRITENHPAWLIATFVLSLVLLFFNLHRGAGLTPNQAVQTVCLYNMLAIFLTHQAIKHHS